MAANTRLVLVSLFASSVALCSTAWAGSPVELTNAQLDRITAGAATVGGSVGAAATGLLALTSTSTNTLAVSGRSPYQGQPGYAPSGGLVDGTAVAVGTDLGQSGPTPSTTTSVNTAGAATGNQVINSTVNVTAHGVGGVTIQTGWTFIYGAYTGL
ncbi:MAG: hypothetical protein JO122_07545 [Acetobacteraceae bacterium]|nr:hypothetical protein [Acetobacteraceae bacterium]